MLNLIKLFKGQFVVFVKERKTLETTKWPTPLYFTFLRCCVDDKTMFERR